MSHPQTRQQGSLAKKSHFVNHNNRADAAATLTATLTRDGTAIRAYPGQPGAIAQGCSCSPVLNRPGQGTLHGEPPFYRAKNCPLRAISHPQRTRTRSRRKITTGTDDLRRGSV